MRRRISIRGSVRLSVHWSFRPSVRTRPSTVETFVKGNKKRHFPPCKFYRRCAEFLSLLNASSHLYDYEGMTISLLISQSIALSWKWTNSTKLSGRAISYIMEIMSSCNRAVWTALFLFQPHGYSVIGLYIRPIIHSFYRPFTSPFIH